MKLKQGSLLVGGSRSSALKAGNVDGLPALEGLE